MCVINELHNRYEDSSDDDVRSSVKSSDLNLLTPLTSKATPKRKQPPAKKNKNEPPPPKVIRSAAITVREDWNSDSKDSDDEETNNCQTPTATTYKIKTPTSNQDDTQIKIILNKTSKDKNDSNALLSIAADETNTSPPVTKPKKRRKSAWASGVVPKAKKRKPSPSSDKLTPIKNTNIQMHCLNTNYVKSCAICEKIVCPGIVSHYVNKHRAFEVFVARLSPDISNHLRNPASIMPDGISLLNDSKGQNKITHLCYFCKKEKTFTRQAWIHHFTVHTGEYQYLCKACNIKSSWPFKGKHLCKKNGTAEHRVKLQIDELNKPDLIATICNLCNYTQFQFKNILSHISKQHNEEPDESKYFRVNCLKYIDNNPKRKRLSTKTNNKDSVATDDEDVSDGDMPDLKPEIACEEYRAKLLPITSSSSSTLTSPEKQTVSNTDAFIQTPSINNENDELFDDDTMRLMKDASFNTLSDERSSEISPKSMATRLTERFQTVNDNAAAKEEHSDDDGNTTVNPIPMNLDPIGIVFKRPEGESNDTDSQASTTKLSPSSKSAKTITVSNEIDTHAEIEKEEMQESDKIINEESVQDDEWESCSESGDESELSSSISTLASNPKNQSISENVTRLCKTISEKKSKAKRDRKIKKRLQKETSAAAAAVAAASTNIANIEIKNEETTVKEPVRETNEKSDSDSKVIPDNASLINESVALQTLITENTDTPMTVLDSSVIDCILKDAEQIPVTTATTTTTTTTNIVAEQTKNRPTSVISQLYEQMVIEATRNEGNNTNPSKNTNHSSGSGYSTNLRISMGGFNPNNKQFRILNGDQSSKGEANHTKNSRRLSQTKVINRIDNIGYSVWNNTKGYCCLIEPCGFETQQLGYLLSHIDEHSDCHWSGYCYMCDKLISNESSSLQHEFKHMNDVHLRENDQSQTTSASTLTRKSFLKVRRFSGDTLSTNNLTMPIEQSSTIQQPTTIRVSTPTTILNGAQLIQSTVPPLAPLKPNFEIINVNSLASSSSSSDNSGFLKISNVVGGTVAKQKLPQQPQRQQPQPLQDQRQQQQIQLKISNVMTLDDSSGPSTINLKPWTKNQTLKSQAICDKMLLDISLFSLFKCMGIKCFYHTSNADLMVHHLRDHDKQLELGDNCEMDTSSWLECPYCEELADSCNLLVKHVQEEHSACIFQCPYCFYRSCAAHNIIVHLKIYHSEKDQFVFVCMGQAKKMQNEWPLIFRSREENVRSLTCGEGKFFFLIPSI